MMMWKGIGKYFFQYIPIFWGVPLYLFLQCFWHNSLEHRDFPGPAGTLSLLRSIKKDQGVDWVSRNIRLFLDWGLNIEEANHLLSVGSGVLAIVGVSLMTFGLSTIRAAKWAGILAAVWALSQYFGILTGVDTLAFGMSWFAVGLISVGFRLGFLGLPLLLWGTWLFPWAVGVKATVMPMLVFCGWSLFSFRKNKLWLLLWLPIVWYFFDWSVSYFWPKEHAMVQAPNLNRRTLEYGFFRIRELPLRGLGEGHFLDLWQIALLLQFTWRKHLWIRLLVLIAFGAAMSFVAAGLGEFIRPRYLAPMGLGIFIALGMGIAALRKGHYVGLLLLLGLLIDSWGFFYHWSVLRQDMIGGAVAKMMEPPQMLLQPYQRASDLTVRDLSMTGAVELLDYWQNSEPIQGIAIPRLRDDRQRSVMAYAAIAGVDVVILDPGRCCAGTPVNQYCAQRILKQLAEHQIMVALPLPLKGVERMQNRDVSWRDDLLSAAQSLTDVYQGHSAYYWSFQHPISTDLAKPNVDLPCQFDLKIGERKAKQPPSKKENQ